MNGIALNSRVAGAIATCVFGTIAGSAFGQETFVLAHGFGLDHFVQAPGETFTSQLEEVSGGQLVVEYHPGGDLGDYIQQFEQTMIGSIDMTLTGPATDIDDRLNVSYLAYIVDDWDSAEALYGPGGPMAALLDGVAAELNLKLIGMLPGGFGGVAMRDGEDRRPTAFPGDAAGIKMRVPPFEIGVRRFEAWGFNAVPLPYSELYTSLQLGVVDGRSFGPPTEVIEMQDAISAYILTRDYFDSAFWVANLDWWNGLSEDERGWITTAADGVLSEAWQAGRQKEQNDLQRIRDFGIEVIELSPEELEAAQTIVYDSEWPWMETVLGSEFMVEVRAAAGIEQE